MAATSKSRKTLPPQAERADLGLSAEYTATEVEQIRHGLVPEQMEGKWLIYFENGWLYFHRSWTGFLIYALHLEGVSTGVRVVESWANRNPEQCPSADIDFDRKLVQFLIDALLLGRPASRFPVPAAHQGVPGPLLQHAYVGRIHREPDDDDLFGDWPVVEWSRRPLRELTGKCSVAHDACMLQCARQYDSPLLTFDGPMPAYAWARRETKGRAKLVSSSVHSDRGPQV